MMSMQFKVRHGVRAVTEVGMDVFTAALKADSQ